MNAGLCLLLSVALLSAPALADNSDIVKAQLEQDANAAAARFFNQLMRDQNAPVLGNASGDVTLVKFTDYQCSYCKAAEPRIDKLLGEDRNVRVVVKEFPILGPMSVAAAKAALASKEQGKYHEFHKALMSHRGQLSEDVIFTAAAKVGLDVGKLKADMISPQVADQLIDNFNLARNLKISLTPAYIVNTTVLSGVSVKTSTAKIDFGQEVAAARNAKR
ncbi:MAG: DsbA family protein [Rhodospirillaceae bacterium]|nr:DsbA family protein [Rhodospirillaceae bacterium]